jgi:hypothetical protein
MSNAEVSKILKIESANEFYTLVKDRPSDLTCLTPFIDRMELFLYGCPCDSELHWDQAIIEYRKISKLDIQPLKNKIGCTLIHFYLDDELIGEA